MTIIHTDGSNKDFYGLCVKLDASLNENVPDRKAAGLNSLYNIEDYKDMFLMYDGQTAVCSAGLFQHDDEVCELSRVFVDDEYRGRGLAGRLIEKVEHLAKQKGYKKVMLRTWSCTPYAVRAYEKLGYVQVPTSTIKYADTFPKALVLASIRVYMEKKI
jgi:predicted GNAT family acetyltransferase